MKDVFLLPHVLMFHDIGWESGVNQFAIGLDQFRMLLDECCKAATRPLFTFDDGFAGSVNASVLAVERGFHACVFPVTSLVGTTNRLTWSDLHDLRLMGVEIGSHTVTHPSLSNLTGQSLTDELLQSREILEDRSGAKIESLALPGGWANRVVLERAWEVGYQRVFTSSPGYWDGADPVVPRICVRSHVALGEYARILMGRPSLYLFLERLKAMSRSVIGPVLYPALRTCLTRIEGHKR